MVNIVIEVIWLGDNLNSTILWTGIRGGKYAHQTTATAF